MDKVFNSVFSFAADCVYQAFEGRDLDAYEVNRVKVLLWVKNKYPSVSYPDITNLVDALIKLYIESPKKLVEFNPVEIKVL
jgi:hypothetical protein